MRTMRLVIALFLASSFAAAQGAAGSKSEKPKQIPSFDVTGLDKSADPCVNFYQFACGNWMKNNPIPPDQPSWGRFNELAEHNRLVLRDILETATKATQRTATEQKIGDFFSACMDEAAINRKGVAVLKPEFDRIDAMKDKAELPAVLAHLHRSGIASLFDFSSIPDFKNAKEMIAAAD